MTRNPRALAVVAIITIFLPLQRFFGSPSFEVMRAVDMVLLFAAGMSTGVLVVALANLRRQGKQGTPAAGSSSD